MPARRPWPTPPASSRNSGQDRTRPRGTWEKAAGGFDPPSKALPPAVNAEWIVPAVLRPDTVDVAIRRRSAGPR
ncbi:hypothetical protein AB0L42_17390 [Streptomyces sp. NPDC052287]|uniref:hypothetical protein n=1 Tax=Streptomyces sp. NPDC052287 TaxID=3154950 RepID=UPI00343D7C5A